MRVTNRLLLLIIVFVCMVGPGFAGVVEDAQESLQAVPSDNPAHKALDGTAASGPLPYPAGDSARASTGFGSGSSTRAAGPGSRTGGQGQLGGPNAPASGPTVSETPAAEREAARVRKAKDKADNALSLAGVLLILALILAAAYYSRRFGRED